MKDILLFVQDDAGFEGRLEAALDLARSTGGRLLCADFVQYPVVALVDPMMANADAVLLADAQDRADEIKAQVDARLAQEKVAWCWTEGVGDVASLLAQAGKTADVIVLNMSDRTRPGPDLGWLIGTVVRQVGTPVLAVPSSCTHVDFTGPVLVAWNGSTVLANTVNGALPLLRCASSVTLLQFGDTPGASAEQGAQHLAHNGIQAQIERVEQPSGSVGKALENACRDRAVAYCVMGAYGHSRLREQLFGGVTRHMLEHSPVPLLVAH